MDISALRGELLELRRRRGIITNCYTMDCLANVSRVWRQGDSLLFAWKDHGVERLVFFADDEATLAHLFEMVEAGRFLLEMVTKDTRALSVATNGLEGFTRLMRLANKDCSSVLTDKRLLPYRDDAVGEIATQHDVSEVNRILWSTFHTEVSHLLYDDELAEVIAARGVHIHRNVQIDAILQAEVMPKKFYINQVVNLADRRIIHAIMLKELAAYVERGGRYLYAWVEEDNIASLRFHAKYGMEHDGMWNCVYLLDRE